jgi:hypothetical protein
MIFDAVRCLSQFLWCYSILDTLSPDSLVTSRPSPDYNHFKLEFGTYVHVFEDNAPSNTPKACSLGAIALDPTGNAQGDYNFMSLATGAHISWHQWTALPMTDTAIARVEALGINNDQPLVQEHRFVVKWQPHHPICNDKYNRNYTPPANMQDDLDLPHQFAPINADKATDLLANIEPL